MKDQATPGRGIVTASTLAFVFAFNLTFLVQELFLVLPKAWTPGLEPTLDNNINTCRGTQELQELRKLISG